MQQPLTKLTSFTEDMRRRGMTASTRWLDRGLFHPTGDEMMALGLSQSAMVARLTRLRLANDQPIALEVTSLPGDILPDPQLVENSLYLELEKSGIRPVRAIQRISARNLTDEETLLLGVLPARQPFPFSEWPIWKADASWKYPAHCTAVTPMTSSPN